MNARPGRASACPRLHINRGLARAADTTRRDDGRAAGCSPTARSTQRLRRYVHSKMVGENLAWMQGCDGQTVVQMWLNSPPHRQVMLTRAFRRVGVGHRSAHDACFVTADFASAH